ncbi:MAG: phage integrase N-terminal SAM-like domain-containing protein [Desulforhopalus sp.]|nr:phage integrase N-terminal SAM-like domain-containing protein [Desulforhopalus sp.]
MTKFRPNPTFDLMDQVCEVLRYHHYAYRTEQTYCQWILRYIHYFGSKTHPNVLGAREVERFLSDLVTVGKVSAATQRQALNALVFLYRDVLDIPLTGKIAPIRSKRLQRPPTVLIQDMKCSACSRQLPANMLSWPNCFTVAVCD